MHCLRDQVYRFLLWINKAKGKDKMHTSVGVMKDYKLKVRKLHSSHTLKKKGPSCFWGRNSAILVGNEITSFVLYHIVGLFEKVLLNSKRCELLGGWSFKLCCRRVLEMQRSFEKFSFVPECNPIYLLETQNSKILRLLKNLYGCVKIR